MNHTRNAIRFAIVVFWLVVVGLAFTAFMHLGNAHALSWVTWLFYVVITVVVLYVASVVTYRTWNFK